MRISNLQAIVTRTYHQKLLVRSWQFPRDLASSYNFFTYFLSTFSDVRQETFLKFSSRCGYKHVMRKLDSWALGYMARVNEEDHSSICHPRVRVDIFFLGGGIQGLFKDLLYQVSKLLKAAFWFTELSKSWKWYFFKDFQGLTKKCGHPGFWPVLTTCHAEDRRWVDASGWLHTKVV